MAKPMNEWMRRFIPRLDDHLPDERLADLLCHEVSFASRLVAKKHMARCTECRVRMAALNGPRAERMMSLYRDAVASEELSLPITPRMEFIRRLRFELRRAFVNRWTLQRLPSIVAPQLARLHLPLVTVALLGIAGATYLLWWPEHAPTISAGALLGRAERWDTASQEASDGVVFQTVRITAAHQTVERAIYRDVSGKRRFRHTQLDAAQDRMKSKLAQAGLDWDEPISASSYRGWHDRQNVLEDRVVGYDNHLLTLTTTVSGGLVAEQTLTVRDTDFHPVRRTIAFRDNATVEIAELDFKILPWNRVDAGLFEQPVGVAIDAPATLSSVPMLPRMPQTLTEGQLEEAELGARLILNQLHVDTGAQIEIDRVSQGVEVRGLVETEQLKQTLQTQLHSIPHLTATLRSVEEMKSHPEANSLADHVSVISMPEQSSQLESYLLKSGRSMSAINLLSRQLFESSLTIRQESKAIEELRTRFVGDGHRGVIASATLSELIYSHRERLQTALRRERALLAEVRDHETASGGHLSGAELSLEDAASKNLMLCKELTQNGAATRNAETILEEMSASLAALDGAMRENHAKARVDGSPLDGTK